MTLYHFTVFQVKTSFTLFLDQTINHQLADLTRYQCLIDKFIYLNYKIRPNIIFVIGQLSYHNSDPQIGHLCIAKWVLHYLKKIITLGIRWKNNLIGHRLREKYEDLKVIRYADSSYANNLENKKSITKYYFFISRAIVI